VWNEVSLWDPNTWLNSALWSLHWEVLFSTLVPLYVVIGLVTRGRSAWVLFAVLVALIGFGASTGHDGLFYMPIFGLGVLIASNRDSLPPINAKVATLAIGAVLMLAWFRWLAAAAGFDALRMSTTFAVQAAAAAILVWAVQSSAWIAGYLRHPRIQWLGRRSFALYLVHEPIVVSIALLTRVWWSTIILAPVASLLIADTFYRLCESPSHRMSRRTQRTFDNWRWPRFGRRGGSCELPTSAGIHS
jgi:peptidoglycan/LPS O-acetylase OafA/YrhL